MKIIVPNFLIVLIPVFKSLPEVSILISRSMWNNNRAKTQTVTRHKWVAGDTMGHHLLIGGRLHQFFVSKGWHGCDWVADG